MIKAVKLACQGEKDFRNDIVESGHVERQGCVKAELQTGTVFLPAG